MNKNRMTAQFAGLLLGALMLVASAAAAAAESPDELLARIDARRYIPNLSFVLQMTSYDGEKQVESNTLWGFIKGLGSENKSLIAFADPPSVKGRKMLMDGPVVYLLFPRTTNPIRLSPLQVLMGQASNGDVARTGFAQDYDVQALTDAERDGVPCHLFTLTLKPSRKDVSYKSIRLWVDKTSLRPLYAEFLASDKVLKQVTYKDYRNVLGKDLPFVEDIYDGESPQKHTVLQYLAVGQKNVADTAFRREYLPAWTPEPPR